LYFGENLSNLTWNLSHKIPPKVPEQLLAEFGDGVAGDFTRGFAPEEVHTAAQRHKGTEEEKGEIQEGNLPTAKCTHRRCQQSWHGGDV
jgi:hypothetical protein